jgi:ssDNA-binding Zn-finger/Zn-ribbon topoisomerase 1
MKITMYKTRPVKVSVTVTKDENGNVVVKDYLKQKYVCPNCDSLDLGIQRGHRHIARCKCNACEHTWNMQLHETTARVQAEIEKYWASNGLKYKLTYDSTAPYEQQLPF